MKINRPAPKPAVDAYRAAAPGVSARPGTERAPQAANKSDTISVSHAAEEAMRLRRVLRQTPEVRLDLVERIKAQVEAGTYSVSPREVAIKLLQSKVLDE